MTGSVAPKFATEDDVYDRFEGTIPDDRSDWVITRIIDVENVLMGLVPSLRKPIADVQSDSQAAGDPGRVLRVVALVCDKVLDLYRNPDPRLSQMAQTMEQDSISRSYLRSNGGTAISFTAAELDAVSLRRKRKRIGTVFVSPGRW